MASLDALAIRRRLGRDRWLAPVPFGPDGWRFHSRAAIEGLPAQGVLLSVSDMADDPHEWVHASIANTAGPVPSYDDLVMLHAAVWGSTGFAYQVFAPLSEHVNIHPWALHLWGRLDGSAVLPNFGMYGSI